MSKLVQIIRSLRRELLILWGVFALWAFSQYLYRFAHSEAYGGQILKEYVLGFTKYMIGQWALTLFIALCGYVVGRVFLRFAAKGLNWRCDLEETVWCTGIGMGLIAIATFLIGLVGLLYPGLFAVLAVLVLTIGRRELAHLIEVTRRGLRPVKWDFLDWALFVVFAALVLETFFVPCNISTGWDALNSHLAAPKFYLRDHSITFYEWINFNNFPQLQEMLLTLEMMVFKDPGASTTYFALILTAVVTYLIGDRYFGRRAGMSGAVLYLLIHEVFRNSLRAFVEHLLVLYSMLLVYAFLEWYETRDRRWLVLFGIAGGLAAGVKYLGVTTVFIMLIVLAIAYFLPMKQWERDACEESAKPLYGTPDNPNQANLGGKTNSPKKKRTVHAANSADNAKEAMRTEAATDLPDGASAAPPVVSTGAAQPASTKPGGDIWRALGVAILWTAIIASPWYIRNIVLFGNPFFPFYEGIFGHLGIGTLNGIRDQLAVNHAEMLVYFKYEPTLWNLVKFPWDLTFHNNYPWIAGDKSGLAGPFFLAFTPAMFFVRRWRRVATLMIIYILLFYTYWLVIEKILHIRYMLGVYPLQVLLGAWGMIDVFRLEKFSQKNKTHLAWVVLLVLLAFGFFYRTTIFTETSGTTIAFTDGARQKAINTQIPGVYLINEVINLQISLGKEKVAKGEVSPSSLVFTDNTIIYGLSCENRRFYVDCKLIGGLFGYANHFDFMKHATSGDELYKYLDSLGCDFLLVNESRAIKQSQYAIDIELPTDDTFSRRFEEITRHGYFVLYHLVGPGETGLMVGPSAGGPQVTVGMGAPEAVEERTEEGPGQ